MEPVRVGIIGGSGVYQMEGIRDVQEVRVDTPFGAPSDAYVVGLMEGVWVAFLPRHGRGHRLTPGEVNSRANIWGFKSLGVEFLVSITACGSMKEEYRPGHVVVPDQLFDRTRGRPLSFFGDGIVVHTSLAEPFSPALSALVADAAGAAGATVHRGGTFIVIEGPRFSTKAESRIFRQWGVDIIGMTAIPEAQLAREAEMCYAALANVTDYDVWHESEEAVTVEAVMRVLHENADRSKRTVRELLRRMPALLATGCDCRDALRNAIVTDPRTIPPETKERLRLLIGKYIS